MLLERQPQTGLIPWEGEPVSPQRQRPIALKPTPVISPAPVPLPAPPGPPPTLLNNLVTGPLAPGIALQLTPGGALRPGNDPNAPMHGGRPLLDSSPTALSATAQAAAEAAATAPAAPAAPATPKADPTELAALRLLLADPANQELIQQFGGELKPLPTWTSVGQGIEARYGAELGARLYQLQTAQRAVEGEFFQAMDQAQKNPPPLGEGLRAAQSPGQRPPGQPQAANAPGWRFEAGNPKEGDRGRWQFDSAAFARYYAQGDSPAQRAFASLHGPDPVQYVPAPNTEAGGPESWQISGITLRQGRPVGMGEGITPEAVLARDGWVPSGLWRGGQFLDPGRITQLNNNEFIWFDPVQGFSTDADNLKGSWLDRAFPQIMGVAFGFMGAFAVGQLVASAGSVVQGAAMGATGSALNQLVSTGQVNFKQVLNSALAGGLTAGIAQIPGADKLLNGAQSALGKLLQATGRATVQGAIQAVTGGQFKDGFINGLMSSAASEVSSLLNAHIDQLVRTGQLSQIEASSMRLLSRATGSALRIAANPGDPAAGFASDFLGGLMQDGLASRPPQGVGANTDTTAGTNADLNAGDPPQSAGDPLGEFIAQNEQAWAERQANYDRIIALFGEPPAIDRSEDTLLAAGPGFAGVGTGQGGAFQVLDEIARRTQGAVVGTLSSFADMAEGTAQVLTNSALQVADLLTVGYNHDHPRVQQAWSQQQQLGQGVINALLSPRESTSRAIENIVNRYDAAMALRDPYQQSLALGQLFNDVGQAAAGLGYSAASVVRPGAAAVNALGGNAFTGPAAGGRGAQRGGVNVGGNELTFGRVENQISHTFRHVDAAGLDRAMVSSAVASDISRIGNKLPSNPYSGSVVVNGRQLDYVAYKLPDGVVNVGRITPRR